jgi:hypothetical protein
MTREVHSSDLWLPKHGEKPADASVEAALAQLYALADRQLHSRQNGPAETLVPALETPVPAREARPPEPSRAPADVAAEPSRAPADVAAEPSRAPADVAAEPSRAPADVVSGAKAAPHARPRTAWAGFALLIVALGVLGQAWIGYQGRTAVSPSSLYWYLSLCLIFTPCVGFIMSARLSDQAKIWLTLYTSLALLITRFMLYPTQFVYHDELINYRVLLSIVQTKHLFTPNSLLPATADYSGMEVAASAIHQLTGLSLHSSGMVILIMARIIMTLALIRIIQRISKKVTVGCLAALIYAANPQYALFNSQFVYQSLALPLCFFCIYVFTIPRNRRSLATLAPSVAVVAAVATTHHLTSLALVIVLWIWYILTRITRRPTKQLLQLAFISLMIVAARTWLARSAMVPYINEIVHNSMVNIVSLLSGKSNHRFFTDNAGDHNPAWQAALAIASVLIFTTTLMPALWLAITKRRLLAAPALVMFAIAALYLMLPVGHLTNATAEIADRSSGFVFVGLGYLVATWWFRDVPFHRHARAGRFTIPRHRQLLVLGLTICFAGSVVIGSGPDWLHGPGQYLVSADNRSIDQLALQAAFWEGRHLPPDARAYTDRVNGLLAAVYGNQHVLTPLGDGIASEPLSTLLLGPPTRTDFSIACEAKVQFLIADQRLASSLPHVGSYIDRGEYPGGIRTSPPPASDLTKFDAVPGAQRIFDNGAIRIYDLRGFLCAGTR